MLGHDGKELTKLVIGKGRYSCRSRGLTKFRLILIETRVMTNNWKKAGMSMRSRQRVELD
jgi:hypothetical protein